jgi:hypothetical protein
VPDICDTLICASMPQTINNKQIINSNVENLTLLDNQLKTSTNNILTFPDITDMVVTEASLQDIMNKQFTNPIITNL